MRLGKRPALVKEARKFRMFREALKQLSLDEQEDKYNKIWE